MAADVDPLWFVPRQEARLVGAVLAEQRDEWQIGRRYMNQSTIREALITIIDTDADTDREIQPDLHAASA